MALGDNHFSKVSKDLGSLLEIHGIDVKLQKGGLPSGVKKNIYGTPQNYTPETTTERILVTGQKLDETPLVAGGRPKEKLYFMVRIGAVKENDDITYNNHDYHIHHVYPSQIGGQANLETCIGIREVNSS